MILALALVTASALTAPSPATGGQTDENQVYVLTRPEHSWEEIEKAHAEMPPVVFAPLAGRWKRLPHTAGIPRRGKGEQLIGRLLAAYLSPPAL